MVFAGPAKVLDGSARAIFLRKYAIDTGFDSSLGASMGNRGDSMTFAADSMTFEAGSMTLAEASKALSLASKSAEKGPICREQLLTAIR